MPRCFTCFSEPWANHSGFFSSPLCTPCQGLSSACQDGVSPWPWWPVLWCWVVSCWCPGWPTSVATGRFCKLSSSAPSCSCCPTSGKIKHKRLLHLATDSRLVKKDLKPCRQLNSFASSFEITSFFFFLTAVPLAKRQASNTYEFPKIPNTLPWCTVLHISTHMHS